MVNTLLIGGLLYIYTTFFCTYIYTYTVTTQKLEEWEIQLK